MSDLVKDLLAEENAQLRADRDRLRQALVGLIGADTAEELDAMEMAIRAAPAPAVDKAAAIDALQALRLSRGEAC